MQGGADGADPPSGDYVRLADLDRALRRRDPLAPLARRVARSLLRLDARRQARRHASQAIAEDAVLLDGAVDRLKRTGVIEYSGEYGAELTTFVPFVFWLKAQGLLAGRRLVTYVGMRPYYYFLDDGEYAEKAGPRAYAPIGERLWPTNSTWHARLRPWHVVPDYRGRYAGQGLTFRRPVLFVQNKFTVEHLIGPINYLPLNALARLLQLTAPHFDVVYSRPGAQLGGDGYSVDDNAFCDYPDRAVVRRFDHVLDLEAHCAGEGAPYNQTKLEMMAKSRLFVAVQGGGAHLMACFGGSLLLLLHRMGFEYPHAYAFGPYKHLSTPPPLLLAARDDASFEQGVEFVGAVRASGDDLWLYGPALQTVRRLRC